MERISVYYAGTYTTRSWYREVEFLTLSDFLIYYKQRKFLHRSFQINGASSETGARQTVNECVCLHHAVRSMSDIYIDRARSPLQWVGLWRDAPAVLQTTAVVQCGTAGDCSCSTGARYNMQGFMQGFKERIQYKLCVIAFKCQHSLAPPYLFDQLQQVARMEPRQRLRSSSSPALVVPATIEGRHYMWPSVSCRCRQGVEQSAVNSHCCVNPEFVPSSPENSSIHRIFPTILVTLSVFWANVTCFWLC